MSNIINVTSGVPQGAHLLPILFNIFINNVAQCFLFSNYLLYADDIKIFISLNNSDSSHKLQSDLNRFYEWSTKNGLQLNISKCKCKQFSKSLNYIPF